MADTKKCTKCNEVKSTDDFYWDKTNKRFMSYCKQCGKAGVKKHRTDNPDKHRQYHRTHKYKTQFDLTVGEYEELLAQQDGKCAICQTAPGKKMLAVDHDHNTGRVRALLCTACNTGLGLFKDDPVLLARAISYLDFHLEQPSV